jgi:hypothetical protein
MQYIGLPSNKCTANTCRDFLCFSGINLFGTGPISLPRHAAPLKMVALAAESGSDVFPRFLDEHLPSDWAIQHATILNLRIAMLQVTVTQAELTRIMPVIIPGRHGDSGWQSIRRTALSGQEWATLPASCRQIAGPSAAAAAAAAPRRRRCGTARRSSRSAGWLTHRPRGAAALPLPLRAAMHSGEECVGPQAENPRRNIRARPRPRRRLSGPGGSTLATRSSVSVGQASPPSPPLVMPRRRRVPWRSGS